MTKLSRNGPAKISCEAHFQKALRASLKVFFGVDKVMLIKTHGNQFTGSGVPDIIGHVSRDFVGIECKVYKKNNQGRPSAQQITWLRESIKRGGIGLFAVYDIARQVTYWVPADQPFTYRDREKWYTTGWRKVKYKNHLGNSETIFTIDCTPLMAMLAMRE